MFSSGVLISIIFAVTHSEIKGIGFDLHSCMCCVLNSSMTIRRSSQQNYLYAYSLIVYNE